MRNWESALFGEIRGGLLLLTGGRGALGEATALSRRTQEGFPEGC